jgi:GcrA cell cycle regulator
MSFYDIEALWAEGLSASQIGLRIGITKNAVIGRVHRMGLPSRPSPLGAQGAAALRLAGRPLVVRHVPVVDGATLPPLASAVAVRKTPKPEPAPPVAPPKPRRDEARGCQWIEGSGSPWQRCGAPVWRYSSWCEEHYRRVYVRRSSLMQPEPVA